MLRQTSLCVKHCLGPGTGDRNEIVIEHSHRYDVFSAPDTVTNAKLCGNQDTILPAGYFYARYAAIWVLERRPKVEKNLPVVTNVPDKSDTDQYGAYIYYSLLKDISARMTLNEVKVPNSFLEAVSGTLDWEYFFKQAKVQYLENPNENVDVVVFGHTHVSIYHVLDNGKYYINEGTWIDHNTSYPEATRTFAVITTGEKATAYLYIYEEDGSVTGITTSVSRE